MTAQHPGRTVHHMRRSILAGLAAITGITAAALAWTVTTAPTVVPATAWPQAVHACTTQPAPNAQACLTQAWANAVTTDQLPAFTTALTRAKNQDARIDEYCHQAGHDAGEHATSGSIDELQRALTSPDTCDNALMHGTLDSFGKTQPSDTAVTTVARICSDLTDPVAAAFCAEGLGHASWVAARDPATSARWCSSLPDRRWIGACVTGVAMQQLNDGDRIIPADRARAELEPTCTVVETLIPEPDAAASCYREVAGAWAQDIAEQTQKYAAAVQNRTATPAQEHQAITAWSQLQDRCRELPNAHQQACRERVAELVEWVALDHRPAIEKLCTAFADTPTREYCLATRRPYGQ